MKFSEYNNEETKTNKSFNNENISNSFENLVNKYAGLSESELLKEFLSVGSKEKNNGILTNEKIQNYKNILFPYLNEEQKLKFQELIKMVNNDK